MEEPLEPQPAPPQFEVPEAYREKGWAKNIKSAEDLWKSYDNAQGLIGKKYIPPDLTKATDEEREAYYAALRPKDAGEYEFPEDATPEERQIYADLLHKNGISKVQASGLINALMQTSSQIKEQMFSEEGMKAELEKSFGKGYEERAKEAATIMKKFLSPEDQDALKGLPNQALAMVYRLTASISEAYGAKEGDGGGHQTTPMDVSKQISEVSAKLQELTRRPHTTAEKSALLSQLNNLNKQRANT